MRFLWGFLAAIVLGVLLGFAFIYSGIFNVAAAVPHTELERWVLQTAKEHSVRARADEVTVPDLSGEDLVESGFMNFDGTCAPCHGAPGIDRGAIGRNQTPQPPALAQAATRWSPAELFWIVTNGIKMTGMPAWGPEFPEEDRWAIVAFIGALPDMSPEQYEAMRPIEATEAPDEEAPDEVVAMVGIEFDPPEITVEVGDTVTWRNDSQVEHTVTADPELAREADSVSLPEGAETFDSGIVAPGETFQHTFTVPGRYRYFCIPHEAAGMVAEVVVEEASD